MTEQELIQYIKDQDLSPFECALKFSNAYVENNKYFDLLVSANNALDEAHIQMSIDQLDRHIGKARAQTIVENCMNKITKEITIYE